MAGYGPFVAIGVSVLGQIKWNRGLHQLLRGLAAARARWRFERAVHNVLKLRTTVSLA